MTLTQEVISEAFLQSANSEDIAIPELLNDNPQFNNAVTAAMLLHVLAGPKRALASAIALGFDAGVKAQELSSNLDKEDVPQTTSN